MKEIESISYHVHETRFQNPMFLAKQHVELIKRFRMENKCRGYRVVVDDEQIEAKILPRKLLRECLVKGFRVTRNVLGECLINFDDFRAH